jgi:uncharacterized membrane protein YeaQ/YmgE (transglycosylase-associated protein family)
MIGAIIGAIIVGAIIGYGARAILPGGQNIGLPKTIGLGILSNLVVSVLFQGLADDPILSVIVAAIVGAGIMWFAIKQGWLRPG